MSRTNYFERYIKKEDSVEQNKEVWAYTRVSSKEQFENNSSIDRQTEASEDYAFRHGYRVIERFGGTYESAKSDFTRKEFTRLIEKVRSSRRKPYAILVYKMSRFSRSGGSAIGLVNNLVEEQGVHLIEVASGLSTISERGKAAVYESLFHAYKENLERKEIIIPNMKAYLKKGHRFGQAPFGYDHYGPRVRKGEFLSKEQKIVVNKEGLILKEAFNWKLSGLYSDAQILSKLKSRGVHIIKQHISTIWRNPFYCGILINSLSSVPISGKWEPLITEANFIRLQSLLERNHSGYQQVREESMRPLTRTLVCIKCGNYLVGYNNKKKGLHYYRCLRCTGVSLSANTKPRLRKKSAEELFNDLLDSYQLPSEIKPLIALQLKKIFQHYQSHSDTGEEQLKKQIAVLNKQLKDLRLSRGLNKIDTETFEITKAHIETELGRIQKEMEVAIPQISNLEKLLCQSMEKLQNLSKIWSSSGYEGKRILQKTLFPTGVQFDAEKHQYLTSNCNQYLKLISLISNDYEENKKATFQDFSEKSPTVPRSRLELPTFGL